MNVNVPIVYQRAPQDPAESIDQLANLMLKKRGQEEQAAHSKGILDLQREVERRQQQRQDFAERRAIVKDVQDDLVNGRAKQAQAKIAMYGNGYKLTGGESLGEGLGDNEDAQLGLQALTGAAPNADATAADALRMVGGPSRRTVTSDDLADSTPGIAQAKWLSDVTSPAEKQVGDGVLPTAEVAPPEVDSQQQADWAKLLDSWANDGAALPRVEVARPPQVRSFYRDLRGEQQRDLQTDSELAADDEMDVPPADSPGARAKSQEETRSLKSSLSAGDNGGDIDLGGPDEDRDLFGDEGNPMSPEERAATQALRQLLGASDPGGDIDLAKPAPGELPRVETASPPQVRSFSWKEGDGSQTPVSESAGEDPLAGLQMPTKFKRAAYRLMTPQGEVEIDVDALKAEQRNLDSSRADRLDEFVSNNEGMDPDQRAAAAGLASLLRAGASPEERDWTMKAQQASIANRNKLAMLDATNRAKSDQGMAKHGYDMELQDSKNAGALAVAKERKKRGAGGASRATDTIEFKQLSKMQPEIRASVNMVLQQEDFKGLNKMGRQFASLVSDVASDNPAQHQAALGEFATLAQSKGVSNRLTDKDFQIFAGHLGSTIDNVKADFHKWLHGGLEPGKKAQMLEATSAWAREKTEQMAALRESLDNMLENHPYLNEHPELKEQSKRQWIGTFFPDAGAAPTSPPAVRAGAPAAPSKAPAKAPSADDLFKQYGVR